MENIKSTVSKKFPNYFINLIIATLPITSLYEVIPGVELFNVGNMVLFIIILNKIIRSKLQIEMNMKILLFFLLLLIFNSLSGIISFPNSDQVLVLNNNLGIIVAMLFCAYFDSEKKITLSNLYPFLKIVAICSTIYLIIQSVFYYFLGIVIYGRIPFLSTISGGFQSINWGRPTSFFLESGHYAQYVAPVYFFSLQRKEIIVSVLLAIGLVLSTSSTGIFMVIFIPFLLFFYNLFFGKIEIKMKTTLIFILTMLFVLGGLNFLKNYSLYFSNIFQKFTISSLAQNPRLFYNIRFFKYFDMKEIMLGVGLNRMESFLIHSNLVYNNLNYNYANSFLFAFFSFGVFGGTLFIYFFLSLSKRLKAEFKVLTIVVALLLLTDQILFNRTFFYLIALIISVYHDDLYNKN